MLDHLEALGSSGDNHEYKYLLRPEELLCRSYEQYLATRSGNPTLRAELETARQARRYWYWTDEEFKPIMEAIDAALSD